MVLERNSLLNNRYQIIEILGQGGMGSIYRALDENLGVDVAVKDNLFTTDEYARQFRREAEILAKLRHPNLPRVTDHFVIPGQGQYLVMDYIEGEDLRQRMDRLGQLPEEEVIIIGVAVLEALSYMETRNPPVIHRDIKPGNIKISPTGEIFLVDFGLVKMLYDSQITATGARAMTPGYSPPEQYGTARTDNRTDIYSLGATLYAALTGAIPEDALARAMNQEELSPVRKHAPHVSRRLANVIEKSIEVRPDDRYQTADLFKQALLSARSVSRRRDELLVTPPPFKVEEPVVEEPKGAAGPNAFSSTNGNGEQDIPSGRAAPPFAAGKVERLSSPVAARRPSRRPFLRSGCMIIVIVVIGLGGLSALSYYKGGWAAQLSGMLFSSVPDSSPSPTEKATFAVGVEGATPTGQTPKNPTVTASPPASAFPTPSPAFTFTPTLTRTTQPTATFIPTITPTPVPTPLGGGGGQIAFSSKRSGKPQIQVVNVDDTGSTQITFMPDGACQPSWSPDGKRLVFIAPCEGNWEFYPGAALFLVNADGSELTPLPSVPGGDFDPAWSPDGKKIAFTSLRNNNRTEIYVLNLDDLTTTVLSPKYGRDRQPGWSADGKQIIFVSDRDGNSQIWVMGADGSNQRRFSQSPERINLHPNWSPDQTLVLFTQLVAPAGIPQLAIAPFVSEEYLEYRLIKDQSPMRDARFSPDGYWVTYEGWPAGSNHDIYIMASNGAGRRPVASDPAVDFDPAWNPNQ